MHKYLYKMSNNLDPIYNFNKTINLKNNLQLISKILKNKTKNNILFISTKKTNENFNIMFFKILSDDKFLVLKKWPSGFITNFYQMCNSYKNSFWYKFLLQLDLIQLKYIFLDEVPEKNTNLYKELILLKQTLNITIISVVDINQRTNKKNSIIDLPLYYNTSELNTDSLIYFILLKYLIK